MEPGVPFALLGGVLLLTAAAWGALAVAALASRRRPPVAAGVLVAGTVVLVVVEALTAVRLGSSASDDLALARAAGLLLVAAGLYGGGLPAGHREPAAAPAAGGAVAPAVVVPLGAAPGPAVIVVAAGALAGLGALRLRRDAAGALLALGLLLSGASAAAAPAAREDGLAAAAVLGLRGASALALCAGLLALARSSLLAKVVAAILAGVVAMGTAAVGVVGTTVAEGYSRDQAAIVEDAAVGRERLLRQSRERLLVLSPLFARGCAQAGFDPAGCDPIIRQLTEDTTRDFALVVPRDGAPASVGGREPLSPAEALGLAGGALVRDAFAGGPQALRQGLDDYTRLLGAEPGLALVAVEPLQRPTPDAEAGAVFVYGVRLGQELVASDFDDGGFGYTLLVGGDGVVASTLSERQQEQVVEAARAVGSVGDGVTLPAQGTFPTVHLLPLQDRAEAVVGTIALSRSAVEALRAQRQALRALLLTALLTTAAVAAMAVLLGRRTVEPVRRLTAAAERVSAGDLATRTGVTGPDEVGTLAGAFDTMTGSLERLTGDLRSSAARLETVLASMSDGLVTADAQGLVTGVNRAALALAGLDGVAPGAVLDAPDGAVEGRPLDEVLDLRAESGAPLPLDPATTRDEPAELRRPDGQRTPVRVAVTSLDVGDGAEGGLVVVLRDTTREREVERMKTEFLSNVSHELRTPLTPIRGYADLLAGRSGLTPQQVSTFAGTILAEALKMNRVVDLLVDVAAIEAGRMSVEPRPVDVRALLDDRVTAWRERAPERSEDLRRRVAAGLPPALADPEWLAKVLDELIDNAVKHTPPGTPITLLAAPSPDGRDVRVAVRDAGPGVDPADQESLFTSFEQKDGSATRRVGGLGLGLSFARRVAQDAGWRLTVASPVRAGRTGAEFALDVPVSPEPATRPASRAAPRPAAVPGQGRSPARPARRRPT
jgi:two-component system, OmpR family, sensor histidine kinase VicK